MTSEADVSPSLRERKKLATREALAMAALHLALERGLEHVRVEEIAARVGLSPRTFNNYFSSKEEAIVSIAADRSMRVCAALRARPPEEPLVEALSNAFIGHQFGDGRLDAQTVRRFRLVVSSPALRGEYLKANMAAEVPLAEAIAERIGADATRDLHPRVLAAAVSSAVRVATGHWINHEGAASRPALVRQAIRQVVCEGALR